MSVERLPPPANLAVFVFSRLQAIWGMRFTQLWRGADMGEVYATWNRALANTPIDRVTGALHDCQNADKPPDLPAFLALCRAHRELTEQAALLPYEGRETGGVEAKRNLERVRRILGATGQGAAAQDPLFWARHPKGPKAVEALYRAAQGDHRLRAILLDHVANGAENMRSDDAVRTLVGLMESGAIERLRNGEANV